ncbi:uncharacterized protein Fot_10397 [Forsythia ovata]|uniref:DNL-type domain-containing protein n=1 Tax=Forsythia ovata TaxID=205694 RepID=A0ABD1WH27_9LAMI
MAKEGVFLSAATHRNKTKQRFLECGDSQNVDYVRQWNELVVYENFARRIQTHAEVSRPTVDPEGGHESSSSKNDVDETKLVAKRRRDFLVSANSFSYRYENFTRRIQTHAKVSRPTVDPEGGHESSISKNDMDETKLVARSINDENTAKHSVKSNLQVSKRHDLAMIFTCKVCDTRSVKTVCRESYDKGVVVAKCDGCNNLIADR